VVALIGSIGIPSCRALGRLPRTNNIFLIHDSSTGVMKGLLGFSFFDFALAVALIAFVLWMVSIGPNGTIF
jgi:hypothetical protein